LPLAYNPRLANIESFSTMRLWFLEKSSRNIEVSGRFWKLKDFEIDDGNDLDFLASLTLGA